MQILKSEKIILMLFFLFPVSGIFPRNYPAIESRYIISDDKKFGTLILSGDIKASREIVWNAITSPDTKCARSKSVLKYSIQNMGEGKYIAYSLFNYPWPLENKWQRILITRDRKNFRVSWERLDGTILRNTGYYQLEENGEFTTINYSVEFDPGLESIPDSLIHYVVKTQAPGTLKNLRKCVYTAYLNRKEDK